MYRHLLIATDGSRLSQNAARKGIQFARSLAARVTCIHVTLPFGAVMDEGYIAPRRFPLRSLYEAEVEKRARKVLQSLERIATQAGVACQTIHASSTVPYRTIIDAARRRRCDLITMGSHGRHGLSKVLLGSETTKALTHSKIPILVFR